MYSKTIIAGNLGRDPELRYTPDGTAVTTLNVATNRAWTDRATGERREETTWFRVSVWGRQAEACAEHLRKGRQVLVEGRLQPDPATGGPRLWQRGDGTVGASYEVRAFSVTFLGGNGHMTTPEGENGAGAAAEAGEEIPF